MRLIIWRLCDHLVNESSLLSLTRPSVLFQILSGLCCSVLFPLDVGSGVWPENNDSYMAQNVICHWAPVQFEHPAPMSVFFSTCVPATVYTRNEVAASCLLGWCRLFFTACPLAISRYFANEPFADLHRVEGLRGVFIATLINGSVSEENMRSVITFDKGGTWELLQPPAADSLGGTVNCPVWK